MNYAVIGTGGIGGYYGSRLAQNGHDVHFLLHSDYEFVREHGLASRCRAWKCSKPSCASSNGALESPQMVLV